MTGRARIHVDGVQGFLRVPFDMKYADLYTISGHKIHGPKGIGALVVRKRACAWMPRQIGGGQESGMRSGTENTPGIAGFAAAAREMIERNTRKCAIRSCRKSSDMIRAVPRGGSGIGNKQAPIRKARRRTS